LCCLAGAAPQGFRGAKHVACSLLAGTCSAQRICPHEGIPCTIVRWRTAHQPHIRRWLQYRLGFPAVTEHNCGQQMCVLWLVWSPGVWRAQEPCPSSSRCTNTKKQKRRLPQNTKTAAHQRVAAMPGDVCSGAVLARGPISTCAECITEVFAVRVCA